MPYVTEDNLTDVSLRALERHPIAPAANHASRDKHVKHGIVREID